MRFLGNKVNSMFPWQPVIIMFIVLLVDRTFADSSDWVRSLFEGGIVVITIFSLISRELNYFVIL